MKYIRSTASTRELDGALDAWSKAGWRLHTVVREAEDRDSLPLWHMFWEKEDDGVERPEQRSA